MTETIHPTPFQARVLSVAEDHFIFLGGGRGGGKSFALQLLILRHCDQYRNRACVWVTRRRLKSMMQFAYDVRLPDDRVMPKGAWGIYRRTRRSCPQEHRPRIG